MHAYVFVCFFMAGYVMFTRKKCCKIYAIIYIYMYIYIYVYITFFDFYRFYIRRKDIIGNFFYTYICVYWQQQQQQQQIYKYIHIIYSRRELKKKFFLFGFDFMFFFSNSLICIRRLLMFLAYVLLFLSLFCHVVVAGELPNCSNVQPFFAHTTGEFAVDMLPLTSWSIFSNVTCMLHPRTAVVTLMGTPDGRLLSPLRTDLYGTMQRKQREKNAEKKMDSGDYLIVFWLKYLRRGFYAYPWSNPAAVERFFFQRRFSIRFELNTNALGRELNNNELLSWAVFDHIRVTSFFPLIQLVDQTGKKGKEDVDVASDIRVGCDFAENLGNDGDFDNGLFTASRFINGVAGAGSWLSFFGGGDNRFGTATKTVNMFFFEELGPRRGSGSWMPSWLAAGVGSRPIAVRETLLRRDDGLHAFVFDAEAPAVKPVCFRIAAVDKGGVRIHVEDVLVFDIFWLKVILLLLVVRFLQPWIEENTALQVLLAGLGGVIVLVFFVIFYFLRKLQNMTLGKIGFFAVVALGGMSAFAESFFSACAALINMYFAHSHTLELFSYAPWIFIATGLACGLVAKCLLSRYLFFFATCTVGCIRAVLFLCALLHNREATFLFFIVTFVFKPSRLFRLILWCSRSSGLENRDNDPQEIFPRSARREVKYVPPLCAEGFVAGSKFLSTEDKLQLYEVLGNEYTQRALAHLAERVRNDSNEQVSRLKDPKSIRSWARKQH